MCRFSNQDMRSFSFALFLCLKCQNSNLKSTKTNGPCQTSLGTRILMSNLKSTKTNAKCSLILFLLFFYVSSCFQTPNMVPQWFFYHCQLWVNYEIFKKLSPLSDMQPPLHFHHYYTHRALKCIEH